MNRLRVYVVRIVRLKFRKTLENFKIKIEIMIKDLLL